MALNNNGNNGNIGGGNENTVEREELTSEDYEIIAAGLTALGEIFAFLALVKAREVTKSTGGQVAPEPLLFVQSRKKKAKRKKRPTH